MLIIIINTIVLGYDHYGIEKSQEKVLDNINNALLLIFTAEVVIKLIAYGPKYYWSTNWNKFDFIIVFLSLIALADELELFPTLSL